MTARRTWTGTFFFALNRFNAIGLAILILCAGYAAWTMATQSDVQFTKKPFGYGGRAGEQIFQGREVLTRDGPVAVYGQPSRDEQLGEVIASDISLTHMKSGRKRLIVPAGSNQMVIRWEPVEDVRLNSERPVARGYFALLSDAASYRKGRMDLVVGNLPELEQQLVARNIYAIDLPTVYDQDQLAVIIWPEPDRASLVRIDLATLKVQGTESIALPKPHTGSPKQSAGPSAESAKDPAPANVFEF